MIAPAQALTLACLAMVTGLLVAEWFARPMARAVLKIGASSAFVLVALSLDAPASAYGRWILVALGLGWVGDALLLSSRPALFLAGLGAFLVSHLCFGLAFSVGAFSGNAFLAALVPAFSVGVLVMRWLWPHLSAAYKGPVVTYIAAILLMCASAAAFGAASGHWQVLLGAVVFAASDISVARDRFVAVSFWNKAWGLPAYFAAQLVMAWSVASAS